MDKRCETCGNGTLVNKRYISYYACSKDTGLCENFENWQPKAEQDEQNKHIIEVSPRKATEGTRMKLRLARMELERLRPQVSEYWRKTNEHS